tara:strand:- start:739 stop:1155 length:417 start_codon:yes stop_codon:yes gene_type:complete
MIYEINFCNFKTNLYDLMEEKNHNSNSKELSDIIAISMKSKKAKEVSIIDLKNIQNSVCDYFVICSGNSSIQIEAIAENIEKSVYKNFKEKPWQKEGENNKEWLLLDFVNVVAHIFNMEKRYHYNLENLWGDGNNIRG